MSEKLITIIIPCYNMGKYLTETISSVESIYDPELHEVIIVDDGSTEKQTLDILEGIKKHKVITKPNGGLSSARNAGIGSALGQYIIFLDSDNLITNGYLNRGVDILNKNFEIDIVYGKSELFGKSSGFINTRPFNLQTLMTYNYIDACCLVRKTLFREIGGFDENLKDGLEDWEMWLRAAFYGKTFYYLEGVTIQKYRMLDNSMMRKLNKNKRKRDEALEYLENKYPSFLSFTEVSDFYFMKFDTLTLGWIAKLFIKKYFPSWFDRLARRGRISKYL